MRPSVSSSRGFARSDTLFLRLTLHQLLLHSARGFGMRRSSRNLPRMKFMTWVSSSPSQTSVRGQLKGELGIILGRHSLG